MEIRCGADAATVAGILDDLVDASSLQLQEAQAVKAASQRYAKDGVDLHDCLIVSLAADRKASVVTFDARAAKRLGMQLLR
jgi:predicted nucleic-acid-binding protein